MSHVPYTTARTRNRADALLRAAPSRLWTRPSLSRPRRERRGRVAPLRAPPRGRCPRPRSRFSLRDQRDSRNRRRAARAIMIADGGELRWLGDEPDVELPRRENRFGEHETGVTGQRVLVQVAAIAHDAIDRESPIVEHVAQ